MKFTDFQKACMEGGHEVPELQSQYGVKPAEFIQTLGEAKMFRTRRQIEKSGARDVADHAFVGILSLYVLSQNYDFAPMASEYAKRTIRFGNFNNPSPSGTDLYQTIHTLQAENIPGEKSTLLFNKIQLQPQRLKTFLLQISKGAVTSSQASVFLTRLERQLAIQDPKLRAARRLIQDWSSLSTNQQTLATTQIAKYYRLNARRSDLMPLFMQFANANKLVAGPGLKSKIAKQVVRKTAAFGAGYGLGKLLGY